MQVSAKVRVPAGMSKTNLLKEIEPVPDSAKMKIYTYNPDQRDPRERGYSEITFTWEV